jgi:hypothetical protein
MRDTGVHALHPQRAARLQVPTPGTGWLAHAQQSMLGFNPLAPHPLRSPLLCVPPGSTRAHPTQGPTPCGMM